MAQDRWGFWYAADCHSKPISQLIRGGCYPSFGRSDDGLGFVPPMMDHLHGPDRNVDEAFRMTMLVLDGGESVNGLVSDRNSESLLLTDQTGKQRRILLSDIEQEKQSKLSLMPGNFDELMTDSELASLIGYLRNAARTQ